MIQVSEQLESIDLAEVEERPSGPSTRAVHGRKRDKEVQAYHSLVTPLVQTATYTFEDTADLCAFMEAKMWGFDPAMTERDSQTDITSLLPLTLGLWLGYLLALLLIDHVFYPRPIFPPFYDISVSR